VAAAASPVEETHARRTGESAPRCSDDQRGRGAQRDRRVAEETRTRMHSRVRIVMTSVSRRWRTGVRCVHRMVKSRHASCLHERGGRRTCRSQCGSTEWPRRGGRSAERFACEDEPGSPRCWRSAFLSYWSGRRAGPEPT